jgi:hypothetical protein
MRCLDSAMTVTGSAQTVPPVPESECTMPRMTRQRDVRRFALSLPETTEQDHHGINSYRVQNRIFATVPDDGHIRIMVDEAAIHAAVAEHPDACEPLYWGKRLACVAVNLRLASPTLVQDLLTDAWFRKAPSRLSSAFASRSERP